jgi:hypothetical protein
VARLRSERLATRPANRSRERSERLATRPANRSRERSERLAKVGGEGGSAFAAFTVTADLTLRLVFEVATRKRMTGSRLQILLELQRHLLTSKLDAHGRSDVSPLAIADTSKDVDESLRSTDHGCIVSKHRAPSTPLKIAERSWGTLRGKQNQTTERKKGWRLFDQPSFACP